MKKTIAALFAITLLATGCNLAVSADEPADGAAGGGASMCAPGVTDCVDAVLDEGDAAPDVSGDPAGTRLNDEDLRTEAKALLGVAESEFSDDVRIGRRGGEQMMLTEDYRVGRFTVELDDDGTGTFRVTAVTVELGDAPETFRS